MWYNTLLYDELLISPIFYANIAQLVEQLFRKQQVRGSSPLIGSIFGVWRSLVARLVRDQKVASSNLVTPTSILYKK